MMDILRRIIGFGEDPTKVLKEKLDQGKEGVTWVAKPNRGPFDLGRLTEAERARITFADFDAEVAFANSWGPKAHAHGGPLLPHQGLVFVAFDEDTAQLTVADSAGRSHQIAALWVGVQDTHPDFAHRRGFRWATGLTDSTGAGLRAAMVTQAYSDHCNTSLKSIDLRVDLDGNLSRSACFAAAALSPMSDILTLQVGETQHRYFLMNAQDLPMEGVQ